MKQTWKPGNMLYPLPAVLVTTRDRDGRDNVLTVAWAGTVNTNPPMLSISVRKNRFSCAALMDTGVFVVNLTTEALAHAADYCGVKSGRDTDKFKDEHLTKEEAAEIDCPMIAESPVNIECRVTETKDLGSHIMFLSEVVSVHADTACMDADGRFDLARAKPIVYSHGDYMTLGRPIGHFGWSVKKGAAGRIESAGKKQASKRPAKPKTAKPKAAKPDSAKPKAAKPDSAKPKAAKTAPADRARQRRRKESET
ncbi:MAG: flavin reductase [Lachnospiraceae bacterium]|nr:flavin reductase [Lachnospiraceae bacterium]